MPVLQAKLFQNWLLKAFTASAVIHIKCLISEAYVRLYAHMYIRLYLAASTANQSHRS